MGQTTKWSMDMLAGPSGGRDPWRGQVGEACDRDAPEGWPHGALLSNNLLN